MSNYFKFLLVIMLFFAGILVQAQTNLKFGHIDSQALLSAMPESDSAQSKIQRNAKELEETLEEMQVELNKKYENYLKNVNSYSELIRTAKETELQDLQERIQQFQITAEQDIQKQRGDLFRPIIDKATKAVNDVARENGFTYIFDTSVGAIVYFSEDTEDILELVKARLKIK